MLWVDNNKVYEYNGNIYCETDLSMQDERYAGDLYDLYWEMRQAGEACEETRYFIPENPEVGYETAEELITETCGEYVIGDEEQWEKN